MLPLVVRDLSFRYKDSTGFLFRDINFSLSPGEVLGLMGLSGSGKSTLCYCLNGIIPHVLPGEMQGDVLIRGQSTLSLNLPTISTMIGMVMQDPDSQLFSPTVEDEVAFGPENLCLSPKEIGLRIEEALTLVGMERYRYANPHQLSGGEKQLIALAAVLTLRPDILIFDEALAQLDDNNKHKVQDIISKLQAASKSIILIDHEFGNLTQANRIVVLKGGGLSKYEGSLV